MTPLIRKNSSHSFYPERFRNEPYIVINLLLAGVIVLIMLYSCIFSPDRDDYPVVCIHEKLTGKPCVSCGLSHSFSLVLRGRIAEAYEWNIYGPRVFIFFAGELIMRLLFSLFYIRKPGTGKELILYDISVSVMLFIVCFLPFMMSIADQFH